MKRRKIFLLSAIVFLGCAFTVEIALDASGSVKTLALSEKPDSVRIENAAGGAVVLQKDGDRWTVGDKKYPADAEEVDSLVAEAGSIKVLETVSGGSDAERFGFGGTDAVVVTLKKADKELRRIEVGKTAATSRQTYIRLDGGKSVLLASGNYKRTFGKSPDDLRDKAIFALKPAEVTAVTVAGKENYTLTKGGTPEAWTVAAPTSSSSVKTDKAKVDSWLAAVATLKAEAFAAEGAPMPAVPIGTVGFKLGSRDATLTILAKEGDSKYLCSSSETPYPFYAAASVVDRYFKPLAEMSAK